MQANYYKLCKAIVNNDLTCATRLIDLAIDVDFKNIEAESPLRLAVFLNRLEIAEQLLKKGANQNEDSSINRHPILVYAIDTYINYLDFLQIQKTSLEMIDLLLKLGLNANVLALFDSYIEGKSPLYQAARSKDIELMKILLQYGAEVGALNTYQLASSFEEAEYDETALHMAARVGFVEGAKLLLEVGSDINSKNSQGITPLLAACSFRNSYSEDGIKLVKFLLDRGAKLTSRAYDERTILHIIADNSNVNLVKFVVSLALDEGIDINARNEYSVTSITFISCKNLEIFMKNGADWNIKFADGSFAHHECIQNDYVCPGMEFVQVLKHYLGYKLDFEWYNDMNVSSKFYAEELENLKNEGISRNLIITLYDFLFVTRNPIVRYCNNNNLKKILNECDGNFESKYPHFGSILNVQYRRGRFSKGIIDSAKVHLDKVFGETVLNICSNVIFKYLTDHELKNFANQKFGID